MRTTPALIALLGALAGASASAAAPNKPIAPWVVLSVSDGRSATEVEASPVSIINGADSRPETTWINEKTERIWVAKKRVTRAGALVSLQWADDQACYQLIETLATLIDPAQPAGVSVLALADRSTSGSVYRLEAAGLSPVVGRPSEVRLTNGKTAPIRAVVDGALTSFAPCWSDAPPALRARP